MNTSEYGEIVLNYLRSGRWDSKGREIGYIVAFRDNGTDFRAYVQNARKINGGWEEFGARQRSKSFRSQNEATRWAYQTAQERISKLHA